MDQRDAEQGGHEIGRQPFSENAEKGGARHGYNRGRLLVRVAVLGATGAIIVALMGLLGYVPGLGFLGSVREGYIPMAPSTSISFLVLGGILLAMTWRSLPETNLVLFTSPAALVSLFGALEVAGHLTERDLNFEDALVPNAGHLGEIPIARMSPSTGALFFIAGLAVCALLLRGRASNQRTSFGHWGGCLGGMVLVVGLVFCSAYLYGSPLFYGQGATVPMALTTALAFLMIGTGTIAVAGADAIPLRLLARVPRSDRPMSVRCRILLLALIMIGACAVVMAVMTGVLYRHDIREHRELLQVTAQSQARMFETIASHEAEVAGILRGAGLDNDSAAWTMSQIMGAHGHYEGFGETGEFTLARRDGNRIVFALRHRHGDVEHPVPVAFDSDLAEPMRRALKGLSGTVVGPDYRGETVLAAHEPVAILNMGIVAKIDMSEIREPFIRSGLSAAAIGLAVVLAGTALFFRIGNPIAWRLEAYARNLEKEAKDRKRSEEALQRIEWLLDPTIKRDASRNPPYGDLTKLNTSRVILDSVGEDILAKIAEDYISLLGTSGAIYEANGDYALGIFSSGWCQFLDGASRDLCDTDDNAEALAGGKWRCHESCWKDASLACLEAGHPVDIECNGGIHLYVVPIRAGREIVGAMNVGWGDPPTDPKKLRKIASEFGVSVDELMDQASSYQSRPPFMVETAKRRIETAAMLIGEIVHRRKVEKEREGLIDQLGAQNNELERFVYTVSHDLKTPLITIQGFAGKLQRDIAKGDAERIERRISRIRGAADKMQRLLSELLELSRIGRVTGPSFEVLFSELAREATEAAAESLDRRSMRVVAYSGSSKIRGDCTRLAEVMQNLIENAVKYMGDQPNPRLEIGVRQENSEPVFYVRDNGIGIDPRYHERIFGLFNQLDPECEGTGVGLALVSKILEVHGGRIWVESEGLGRGSTFCFTVPTTTERATS